MWPLLILNELKTALSNKYVLILLALLALLGYTYYRGGEVYREKEHNLQENYRLAVHPVFTTQVTVLANEETKIVTRTKEIQHDVTKYINNPIYASECFDSNGLRDANRALTGKDASGAVTTLSQFDAVK